jgi:sn-glycerol 3-phosphate transport system permease protein
MNSSRNIIYGSLLLLAGGGAAVGVHLPADPGDALSQLLLDAEGPAPAVFVGADNYARMIADPVFWQALVNNLVYALATIPVSMGWRS